jgi:hypothetical protein
VRLVLVALAVIGAAGVVVGLFAHLAVLLGSPLAWLEPMARWLTPRAVACIVLLGVIRLVTRDWVWAGWAWAGWERAAGRPWWPPGWPAWTKWTYGGYMGYALIQWVRGGEPTPLSLTAAWMFVYGVVLLSSLHLLTRRDDTSLETPGDTFPRA